MSALELDEGTRRQYVLASGVVTLLGAIAVLGGVVRDDPTVLLLGVGAIVLAVLAWVTFRHDR